MNLKEIIKHCHNCDDKNRRKFTKIEVNNVFAKAGGAPDYDKNKRKCPKCGTQIHLNARVTLVFNKWESTDNNPFAWHIDHVLPVANNGCNCLINLQPLCDKCNRKKGRK